MARKAAAVGGADRWAPSTAAGAGGKLGRMLSRVSLAVLAMACLAAACGDGAARPASDGGPPGPGVDAGPPIEGLPGYDARPPNPTCVAPERPGEGAGEVAVRLEPAFRGLEGIVAPLGLFPTPGAPGRHHLIEKLGRVLTFTGDGADLEVAADLRDLPSPVDARPNEGGLLGLAFDPDFADTGDVYVSYTARDGDGRFESRVARLTSEDGGLTFPLATHEILFRVVQPAGNHNGGTIAFGPDGHLYLSLGDGGGANDRYRNGQDPQTVLGAILRLDVTGEPGGGRHGDGYGIPGDNPFADGVDGAPEIFAWGLRNPWRMSFDPATGLLWAGDVGQGALEEIDVVENGGNYGWPVWEGDRCFRPPTCPEEGFVFPVATYGRDEGVSVTGGYVYRGAALPELDGVYLYADYGTGRLWGLFPDGADAWTARVLIANTGLNVGSFARDADGELYLVDLGGGADAFWKLVRDGDPPAGGGPARRLSETGCMDPEDPWLPGPGLVPYAPRAPFWSDGADKRRWLAVPDGETVAVLPDGDLDFPPGTVLVKSFERGGRRVETRLFVRHPDGVWAGYSYEWNGEGTEAFLLEDGKTVSLGDGPWVFPSRPQCLECHTAVANRSLGLELAQLDHDLVYPTNRRANQIDTLTSIGLVETPLPPAESRRPPLAAYDGDAPGGDRARSWLHSNCAGCHRPGGPARGELDLRFERPLASTGTCDEPPAFGDLGIDDARVVAPGDAGRSVLAARLRRLDAARMPNVGSLVVDDAGAALVESWIDALDGCE